MRSRGPTIGAVAMLAVAGVIPHFDAVTTTHDLTLTNSELVAIGGTFMSTLTPPMLDKITQVINQEYGNNFTIGDNVDNLYTPEGVYNGTYQDGEIDLLQGISGYPGDDVTVFGVSQGAGIIGMTIRDINDGDLPTDGTKVPDLPPGFDLSDLPNDVHWVALSPPNMPEHGNATGFAFQPLFQSGLATQYPNITDPFPLNTGDGTADVYCGMYDPICDSPINASNWNTDLNALDGLAYIHAGYAKLQPAELLYEIDHSTLLDMSTATVKFHLMPDVYNFGTAADPDYDSYLPLLAGWTWIEPVYERWLPYYTLQVDAGYDDSLHPFEYMLDGTEYTIYDDQIVPVAGLPEGVEPPVVGPEQLADWSQLALQAGQSAAAAAWPDYLDGLF